nr:HD domain-containing protein [Candidatus Omnitrophota bacterium]
MKERLETDVYFTPREAAKHLNLSLSAIKNYIYANKLKTLKTPGGHHRISKIELLAAMGEGEALPVKTEDYFADMEDCCMALMNVYKLLGELGNFFISHSVRVSEASYKLSKALGLSHKDILQAKMAGLVHDIGHMAIDRRILLKPGSLTVQEYELIKLHPARGEELLNSIKGLKEIADIVGQHHERIDGTGYSRGLKGKDIKKTAKIISIAEAYDSMVSDYFYKKPVSREMAISEIMEEKGMQFDSELVDIFIKII